MAAVPVGVARTCNVPEHRQYGTAYNLAGQRVGKSYKGVVTVNGRKMIRRYAQLLNITGPLRTFK